MALAVRESASPRGLKYGPHRDTDATLPSPTRAKATGTASKPSGQHARRFVALPKIDNAEGHNIHPSSPSRPPQSTELSGVPVVSVEAVLQGLTAWKGRPRYVVRPYYGPAGHLGGVQQMMAASSARCTWWAPHARSHGEHIGSLIGERPCVPPSTHADLVFQRATVSSNSLQVGAQVDGLEDKPPPKLEPSRLILSRRSALPSRCTPRAPPKICPPPPPPPPAVHKRASAPTPISKRWRITADARQEIHMAMREAFNQCGSLKSLEEVKEAALAVVSHLKVTRPINGIDEDHTKHCSRASAFHRLLAMQINALVNLIENGISAHAADVPREGWMPIIENMVDKEMQRRQPELAISAAVVKGVLKAEPRPRQPANEMTSPLIKLRISLVPRGCGGAADVPYSREAAAPVQRALTMDWDPKREVRWRHAFCRFVDTGKIRKANMARALELSGFQAPNKSDIDEIFGTMTKNSTLSSDDYLRFVKQYELRQHKHNQEAFHEADLDNSGYIDVDELSSVLSRLGVEPMDEVLDELINEIDQDYDGQLGYAEFEELMHIIRTREGFTKEEDKAFTSIFERFDWQSCGNIATSVLAKILAWLGYAQLGDDLDKIINCIDVDGNGKIDYHEFLICMRKVREHEIQQLRISIESHNATRSTPSATSERMYLDELEEFLRCIGYGPSRDTLHQVWATRKDHGESNRESWTLTVNHVWAVLHACRSRENFTDQDASQVEEAFQRYDVNGAGEIGATDVGKALRWFGFPISPNDQQHLIDLVDVDCSGKLDLFEFRKLVRLYWDQELRKMREVFESKEADGSGRIAEQEALDAFFEIDFLDNGEPPEIPKEFQSPSGYINLVNFLHLGSVHRKQMREHYREHGGYSPAEMRRVEKLYVKYDTDGNGLISPSELGLLIQDLFPYMTSRLRNLLDEMMQETSLNSNGSLDFQDFVRIMSQFNELQAQETAEKLKQASDEAGFSPDEIKDFKELFIEFNNVVSGPSQPQVLSSAGMGRDELCWADVSSMICSICPISERQTAELQDIFQEATKKYWTSKQAHDAVDFPEFLWMMDRLLRINFAGIKEKIGWQVQARSSTKSKIA